MNASVVDMKYIFIFRAAKKFMVVLTFFLQGKSLVTILCVDFGCFVLLFLNFSKFSKAATGAVRKDVLRNFAWPATLLKKRLWRRCFPVNFAKFLRTLFLQNISGRLLLQLKDDLLMMSFIHTLT